MDEKEGYGLKILSLQRLAWSSLVRLPLATWIVCSHEREAPVCLGR